MDPVSGLKSDTYRYLVTNFIPGAIGAIPLVLLAIAEAPDTKGMLTTSPLFSGLTLLCAAVLLGMLFEDVGSHVELIHWNRLTKNDPAADDEWYAYLRTSTKDEPVGHRYLDTVQMRLKFELSMFPALCALIVGLTVVKVRSEWFSDNWAIPRSCASPSRQREWPGGVGSRVPRLWSAAARIGGRCAALSPSSGRASASPSSAT